MNETYESRIHKIKKLVLWCHYVMEKNGMKNAGLGDNTSMPGTKDMLEILPEGWNDSLPCQLRYVLEDKLYILSINPPDDNGHVMIKLRRPLDNKMSFSVINIYEIPKVKGQLEEVMPNYTMITNRFNTELIYPLIGKNLESPCGNPPARGSNPLAAGSKLEAIPFQCFPAGATIPRWRGIGNRGKHGRGRPLSQSLARRDTSSN